jgi:hypothetical protein
MSAESITASVIAAIERTVPAGLASADLAFEVARELENYGTDVPLTDAEIASLETDCVPA